MKFRISRESIVSYLILGAGAGALFSCFYAINDAQAATTATLQPIVIATAGDPRPFTYFDKDHQLVGYDIEVARKVFSQLPQYSVSFTTTEFTSILAGLDADRFQVGANNFVENAQRKEKYIFSQPIFENQFVIATSDNNTNIHSLSDLLGKTSEVNPGVNFTTALEKYNTQHQSNPVKLQYTDADLLLVLQNLESSKTDFQLIDKSMLDQYISEYHLKLKTIPLSKEESALIGSPYSYFLIAKGKVGEKLAQDINEQLNKLKADGTLSTISNKYFNGDYVPK
ncbi:transporter substrate-binding domain-containing protein [Phytobacter sp. V91]|uniref:transporter substrate-binding domain-containing protein n=1 Tax=Phytobacter sp. V91 TaxID=3369425 RepID=UPI003F5F38F3